MRLPEWFHLFKSVLQITLDLKFFDYRYKFGLNLGAEGQTVRLRGPRSLFHQKFMLNLVLAIIFFLLLQMYVHNHPNNLVLLKLAI